MTTEKSTSEQELNAHILLIDIDEMPMRVLTAKRDRMRDVLAGPDVPSRHGAGVYLAGLERELARRTGQLSPAALAEYRGWYFEFTGEELLAA